jgi:predicted DNA-binding protein (UPF0251 family)/predicted Fe-Mo cluster-binding NifX family protein
MARPINERLLGRMIPPRVMKPAGIPARELEEVRLGLDEAEALRLADLEGLYQEAAARSMGVSRQTFGRIVEAARRKVADAVLNGKALRLEGGEISIKAEGDTMKKIAVPSQGGLVDEHFGHCKEFLVFSKAADGTLKNEPTIPSAEGCGCKSGIASVLAQAGVTHLVAGNMGEGAVRVLASHGIAVTRGATGEARAAAEAFAKGKLADSGVGCVGHGEPGHECAH